MFYKSDILHMENNYNMNGFTFPHQECCILPYIFFYAKYLSVDNC